MLEPLGVDTDSFGHLGGRDRAVPFHKPVHVGPLTAEFEVCWGRRSRYAHRDCSDRSYPAPSPAIEADFRARCRGRR